MIKNALLRPICSYIASLIISSQCSSQVKWTKHDFFYTFAYTIFSNVCEIIDLNNLSFFPNENILKVFCFLGVEKGCRGNNWVKIYVMLCVIWCHLYNLKNRKASMEECSFTKSNTPLWAFFTFF